MKKVNHNTISSHTHIIFVYGTLRKGQWNHYLLDGSKFLGMARTKQKYALYGSGIPFLSRTRAVSQVTGEVYAVDEATLQRLDELEGHPDAYTRELAEVVLENGTELTAWIYFYDLTQGELIESGDFLRQAPFRRR
jgi:gamma-glutamylaminecyclotransferase